MKRFNLEGVKKADSFLLEHHFKPYTTYYLKIYDKKKSGSTYSKGLMEGHVTESLFSLVFSSLDDLTLFLYTFPPLFSSFSPLLFS